jgi:hypothetical protein
MTIMPHRIIESNLNAIARTPIVHRDEFRAHVRLPKLKTVTYSNNFLENVEQSIAKSEKREEVSSMNPLLARLPQGFEQQDVTRLRKQAKKPSTNPWLAHLQQSPQGNHWKESARPPATNHLGITIDLDLGPNFNVPGLLAEVKYSTLQPSQKRRLKIQNAQSVDDAEYESIDPETGETMVPPLPPATPVFEVDDMDDDYEQINPMTGETMIMPKANPNKKEYPSYVAESTWSDECEVIDPETGEPMESTEAAQKSFSTATPPVQRSRVFESLLNAYKKMDIMEDPWVHRLKKRKDKRLQETITGGKTYSQEQMRLLVRKAEHIFNECGAWATDWFISEAVSKFLHRESNFEEDDLIIGDMEVEETNFGSRAEEGYLHTFIQRIAIPKKLGPVEGRVSQKIETLIKVLLDEYTAENKEFSGLVFVEQRVAVAVVAQIISRHPKTKDYFKIGTMVGGSEGSFKRMKYIADLVVNKKQKNTLGDFRIGKRNLIVATSAIEEGLDVQDCHLVVCFDLPKNLKSFVQRRGRARREASSYVLMVDFMSANRIPEFEAMEQEMIKMYSDRYRVLEKAEDEDEDEGERFLKVEKTG